MDRETSSTLYPYPRGALVLAGALVAMLPATLALSGKFLFKEKLSSKQYIGVLLSVAGALLIAL